MHTKSRLEVPGGFFGNFVVCDQKLRCPKAKLRPAFLPASIARNLQGIRKGGHWSGGDMNYEAQPKSSRSSDVTTRRRKREREREGEGPRVKSLALARSLARRRVITISFVRLLARSPASTVGDRILVARSLSLSSVPPSTRVPLADAVEASEVVPCKIEIW